MKTKDDDLYDIYIKPNMDTTIAEIKVKGIQEYALHIAITKINFAINALKLFIPRNSSQFKVKGTIQENIQRTSYLYLYDDRNDDVESLNVINERIGVLHPVQLKKREIEEIEGIEKLSNIMKKRRFSQFEEQLLLGIIWFSEALSIYDNSEKYLPNKPRNFKIDNFILFKFCEMVTMLFTSLESVLIVKRGESIIGNLSERIAILLKEDYNGIIELKKKIKELYDYRSKIIHTGDFITSKDIFYELLYITRTTLIKLVKLNEECEFRDMGDLETYFNKIKYGNE